MAGVSHLKDFRGRDEEAESRWQAGRKDTSSDKIGETWNLAHYLVGKAIIRNVIIHITVMNTGLWTQGEKLAHLYQPSVRIFWVKDDSLNSTSKLLARPYLHVCVWMHSVKFQPRPHPRPTQPSVMFPVRMSVMLPEASRTTHAPGREQRCKYYSHDVTWYFRLQVQQGDNTFLTDFLTSCYTSVCKSVYRCMKPSSINYSINRIFSQEVNIINS